MSDNAAHSDAAPQAWSMPEIDPADTPERRARDVSDRREAARHQAYEQGYAAGLAAGEGEVRERLQRLAGLINSLAAPLESVDEEVETALRNLSFRIARHVVRRELQIDRSQVVAVVREALHALPLNARNIRVRMHPADVEFVSTSLAEQRFERSWEMIEDPLMTRGGCRIESDTSTIDAEVEKRLDRIINHLVEDERQGDRGPGGDD